LKTLIVAIVVLLSGVVAFAGTLNLPQGKQLTPVTSSKIFYRPLSFDPADEAITFRWAFLDSENKIIKGVPLFSGDDEIVPDRHGFYTYQCRNIPDNPATLGVDETDLCFDEVHGYSAGNASPNSGVGQVFLVRLRNRFFTDVINLLPAAQ